MHHYEVLTTCFTHDTRIGAIPINIAGNTFPNAVKRCGGTGKVEAGKVRMLRCYTANERTLSGEEVDYPIGQPSFLIDLHQQMVAQ